MVKTRINIDIEIDLGTVSTGDLIAELEQRKSVPVRPVGLSEVIDALEDHDCPEEVLDPLWAWSIQPIAGPAQLEAWVAGCGIKGRR